MANKHVPTSGNQGADAPTPNTPTPKSPDEKYVTASHGPAPTCASRPEASPVRVVAGVLAAVLIAFCAWSAFQYSQGLDPLAFLGSDALRTVESSDAATISVGADQSATARAKSDATTATGKKDSDGDASKKDASAKSTTAGGSASDGSTGSQSSSASGSSGSHAGGSGGSGSGSGSGSHSGGSGSGSSESTSIIVSVTVDGSAAGAGSSSASIRLSRGATAYDAIAACGVAFNAKSTSFGMYVSSIGGLAEKEHGGMSGWVYAVNGYEPNTACSNYELHDGDSLVWTYVNVTE